MRKLSFDEEGTPQGKDHGQCAVVLVHSSDWSINGGVYPDAERLVVQQEEGGGINGRQKGYFTTK